MNNVRLCFALVWLAILLTVGAHAGPLAYDFSGIEFSTAPDATLGFSFTPTVDIAIDSLVVYDPHPDGTAVRLYTEQGTVLAAALILPTGPEVEVGNAVFHLAVINLTQLTAGTRYFLSAQSPAGSLLPFAPKDLALDPRIVIDGPVSQLGFGKPITNIPNVAATYAVNFTIYQPTTDVSSVPEPGTWALMASGLLCLAATRFRRRQ